MNKFSNDTAFPPKPHAKQTKSNLTRTITNLLLFLSISYFYFDKNINLVLVFFSVLAIHEFGHLFAMRFFNYKDLEIFFVPLLGAFTKGSKNRISQKQSIIIYLSGSVPSILLAVFLYYFSLTLQNNLLYRTSCVIFSVSLINLLPIKPLDGGNVIANLFFDTNNLLKKGFIVISILAMVVVSIYLGSYILLIIPFLLVINQLKQYRIDKIKEKLIQNEFNLNLSFNDLSEKEYWTIRTIIIENSNVFNNIDPAILSISDNEDRIVKYVKLVLNDNSRVKDITPNFKRIVFLIYIISLTVPVYYLQKINREHKHKTVSEDLSFEEINTMKTNCINSNGATIGLKLTESNKVAICDCFINEIIENYTKKELSNIYLHGSNSQIDSFKRALVLRCITSSNDTTCIDSLLMK